MRRNFEIFCLRRAAAALAVVSLLLAVAAGAVAMPVFPGAPAEHAYLTPAALGDSEIDAESQTGRYSLLVRQIQLRLAELGLYGGRIGGVMSAETAEAIRTYQRFANLTVDGKPTHELLENLTSAAGQAQHLLLRLDRAQKDQIEQARGVLEQAFGPDWAVEARAVVVGAVPDLAALKARAERCYSAPEPACLIVEAEVAAESVEKDNLRDWALSDITQAQARIGQSEEALRVARAISDPRSVIAALSGIAVALARAGRTEEALAAAQQVPNTALRDKALRAVAEGQLAAGRPDFAEATVSLIEAPHERLPTLVSTAHSYLAFGHDEVAHGLALEAERLAHSIEADLFREWALSEMASLMAAVGEGAKANTLIAQIGSAKNRVQALCDIVIAELRGGREKRARQTLDVARATLAAIARPAERQQARACLASSYASLAEFEEALKQVRGIELGYTHSFVLSRIVLAMARSGDAAEAVRLAETIQDEKLRISTFVTMSGIARKRGKAQVAAELGARAMGLARELKIPFDM
ncbi:MAG: peptidoglycan-binding domain-containing protein, partial [Alphaproteobacteria bacterium]|nr:peptidoglycan-binding domain-containing protein [Alphaproteobacteria bacterium]